MVVFADEGQFFIIEANFGHRFISLLVYCARVYLYTDRCGRPSRLR
jgi:hypothetical protein